MAARRPRPAFHSSPFFFVVFLLRTAAAAAGGGPQPAPSANAGGQICPAQTCGDLEIKFPLWLNNSDSGETICGHPRLLVDCENNDTAVLHTLYDSFLIAAVDYNKRLITLKDRDLQDDSCPRARHNFTLGSGFPLVPFDLGYILFFFNCSSEPEYSPEPSFPLLPLFPIPCLNNEIGKESYAAFVGNRTDVPWDKWHFCDGGHVQSPVMPPQEIYNLSTYFKNMLQKGFDLQFNLTANCGKCEEGSGICAFRNRSANYEFDCIYAAREKRKWKKILIGVGAGAGGVVLASLFCLFFYRRQQVERQAVNSKLLSLTASSDRSSRKDLEDGGDTTGAPFFRYEELHEATSGFCPSNELGDGGFGTVYKGKLRDGRVVAVKRLYENNFKRVEQFLNEAAILNRLRHPNLVSLYGCTSRHSRELLLVYEYIPNGTVADHLHGDLAPQRALPWSVRLRIAAETASALAYLHSTAPPIIHRDVKTNNILLDSGFHVKVADFGLSRLFPLDVTHISTAPQGTPGYVDPEYHQCYQLTDKSDVYSFGVVLVELISSKPAVDITRRRNEINLSSMAISMIQRGKLGEFVDQDLGFEADPEVRRTVKVVAELAFRCLQTEKEMRPTMEDALEVLRATMGGKEGETEVVQPVKKIEEVSLLKAIMPPRSPNSVMHNWSSQTTTPNASG